MWSIGQLGNMEGMGGKRVPRKGRRSAKRSGAAMLVRALIGAAFWYRNVMLAKGASTIAKGVGPKSTVLKSSAVRRGYCKKCGGPKHRGPCAVRSPVRALGAMSVGATALGALAVGALAIGAVAIRRLALKRGDVERLEIADLKVGRLEVDELLVREETRSQPSGPVPQPPPRGSGTPPPGSPGGPPPEPRAEREFPA